MCSIHPVYVSLEQVLRYVLLGVHAYIIERIDCLLMFITLILLRICLTGRKLLIIELFGGEQEGFVCVCICVNVCVCAYACAFTHVDIKCLCVSLYTWSIFAGWRS